MRLSHASNGVTYAPRVLGPQKRTRTNDSELRRISCCYPRILQSWWVLTIAGRTAIGTLPIILKRYNISGLGRGSAELPEASCPSDA